MNSHLRRQRHLSLALRRAPLALFLLIFITYRGSGQQTENLTNDAIVKMVKSNIAPPLIVQMIQTQPGSYVLTPASLNILKQQGVPDSIISAMIAKPKQATTDHQEQPKAVPALTTSNRWVVKDATDVMSDAKTFSAELVTPALADGANVGNLRVTATCNPETLGFNIVFFSKKEGIGFKQNSEGKYAPGGVIGMVAGHNKPWVNMRVRIDQQNPLAVSSEDDYRNQAVIFFTARTTKQAMTAIDQPTKGQSSKEGIVDFMRLFAAYKSAGSIADVVNAKSLLIELPLEDGSVTILSIKPQDPSFKAFSLRCDVPLAPVTAAPAPAPAGPRVSPMARYSSPSKQPATQFTGTSDEFSAALPGLVERMLTANGVEPHQFDTEVKYVAQLVKTCAGITPKMLNDVTDTMNRAHVEKLGEDYRQCGGSLMAITPLVKTGFKPGDPVLTITMPNVALWRLDPAMKARFLGADGPYPVKVGFAQVRGATLPAGALPISATVVTANIK